MATGQKGRTKQQGRKAHLRRSQVLAAHPAFAPMLGIWGAALAGLSIMVLPAPIMVRASKGTGLVLLGSQGQLILAILAALLLGASLFMVASQLNRKARRRADAPSIVSLAARRVHTIDPARELGSLRLDDPVEAVPFAAPPAPPTAASPAAVPAAAEMPAPRALDLAEFAMMPGRNGPWVEEPAALAAAATPPPVVAKPVPLAAVPAPVAEPPRSAIVDPGAAALAQLRAVPPQELSLVQMIERFAGALHEHREVSSGKAAAPGDLAAREAALAEALRALAVLSSGSMAASAPADEPLHDALTRLQGLRGAA